MKTKLHKEQKEFNYNKKLQQLLSAHVETFRKSKKKAQACFGGKQLSAQPSKEEKMLQQDEKYQRLRDAEAKDSETKFKTSLLQTNVKGQWWCG